MNVNILGVDIDDVDEKEVMQVLEEWLKENRQIFVATPNPEMLLEAHKDEELKEIMNKADIKIADGFGLKLGAWVLGKKINSRVTGTDLMARLCQLAEKKRLSVYLLGAEQGVARKAAENLNKLLPKLIIRGAESGGALEEWDNRVIIEHVNNVCPEIIFVALGHGKQEKWIFKNLKKMPSVKLAMGVGGAFDFYSGRIKRAPEAMRRMGLEWLWRLLRQPKRWKRILNAVIVFPWTCFKNKKAAIITAAFDGAKGSKEPKHQTGASQE